MFRMLYKVTLAGAVALPFGLLALPDPAVAGVHTEGDYQTQYYLQLQTKPSAPSTARAAMSCAAAGRMIRGEGYRNVVAEDCSRPIYRFDAMRHGRPVVLRFDSRTGQLGRT